jgi:hypothetical protein
MEINIRDSGYWNFEEIRMSEFSKENSILRTKVVACIYNPSYIGGGDKTVMDQGHPVQKLTETLSQQQQKS